MIIEQRTALNLSKSLKEKITMARINRVSQVNLLAKSEVTRKKNLLDAVRRASTLIFKDEVEKYSEALNITEKEAMLLQEITPEAVSEWEWEAYRLQDSINFKGVTAKYDKLVSLPNIIDYGEPTGECGLCGHSIRYGYTLRNKVNGNSLVVGSECIHNYGVNVTGGDIGEQAADVVKSAQRRMEREVKIAAFLQSYPSIREDLDLFAQKLNNMPVKVAREVYGVQTTYWVDRRRDVQRVEKLKVGLEKNGLLNKRQLVVYEEIKDTVSKATEITHKIEQYKAKKMIEANQGDAAAVELFNKQKQGFINLFNQFGEYGFKSKWIEGIYETFCRRKQPLTEKQRQIVKEQYQLFLKYKQDKYGISIPVNNVSSSSSQEVKEEVKTEAVQKEEVKEEVKDYSVKAIKEKADTFLTMSAWLAKVKNSKARCFEGYIEKESAKAVFFVGHASAKANIHCTVCGKSLNNKVSRVLGIGPVCCNKLGIERPDESLLDNEEYVSKMTEKVESYTFVGWLPKAYLETKPLQEARQQAEEARKESVQYTTNQDEEDLGSISF